MKILLVYPQYSDPSGASSMPSSSSPKRGKFGDNDFGDNYSFDRL